MTDPQGLDITLTPYRPEAVKISEAMNDHLIVLPYPAVEETEGGIAMPDAQKARQNREQTWAWVLIVPALQNEYCAGDTVIIPLMCMTELHEGLKERAVKATDIIAKIPAPRKNYRANQNSPLVRDMEQGQQAGRRPGDKGSPDEKNRM